MTIRVIQTLVALMTFLDLGDGLDPANYDQLINLYQRELLTLTEPENHHFSVRAVVLAQQLLISFRLLTEMTDSEMITNAIPVELEALQDQLIIQHGRHPYLRRL